MSQPRSSYLIRCCRPWKKNTLIISDQGSTQTVACASPFIWGRFGLWCLPADLSGTELANPLFNENVTDTVNSERDSADWNCSLNFWKQPFQFRLAVPFLRSYVNGKSEAMCGICVAIFTLFFEFVQVAGLFSAGVVVIYSLIFGNRKVRSLQPWRQGCCVLSIGPQADFNRVCPDRRLGGLEWKPFPPRYCWIFHLIYIYILI